VKKDGISAWLVEKNHENLGEGKKAHIAERNLIALPSYKNLRTVNPKRETKYHHQGQKKKASTEGARKTVH